MGKKMMRLSLILVLVFIIVGIFRASQSDKITTDSLAGLQPESIHPRVEQIVYYLLSKSHYQRKELNDSLSSQIFDSYLDILDYQHYYRMNLITRQTSITTLTAANFRGREAAVCWTVCGVCALKTKLSI